MPSSDAGHLFASSSPTLMGIWKLGQLLYSSDHSRLFTAQPADADGSPRFDYALRTISEKRETREESFAQLSRFASAASMASHPNLIVVLDASLQSAAPFLVMPRLIGSTLAEWFVSTAPQPLPVILWAVRQTAQALATLHASSWVHGDVKPANIFISQQGHVTLLDLGFARHTGTLNPSVFMGTPQYAAPETTDHDAAPAMAASDVSSLGKVLLESLAWTTPTIRNQAVLEPVADLVVEMIAQSPAERPTASDVATRLLRLEIETLGEHIQPTAQPIRRAA